MIELSKHYYSPSCYWAQMMTFRCNARCDYCILDRRKKHIPRTLELTGYEILNFWNNLDHKIGQRLSLIGGEPFLHRDILEIINNLEGYSITVTTNCKNPFIDQQKYKQVQLKQNTTLRINTTFHPHFISAERYIEVIKELRSTGYFVDQTSYVLYPNYPDKYKKEIEKVSEEIEIYDSPYMGFWSKEKGFDSEPDPKHNEPNENYHDPEIPKRLCNIVDLNVYRDLCGQKDPRSGLCWQPYNSLIIDPEGWYYPCHYRLYYAIKPFCRINDFRVVNRTDLECDWIGFCNWCDHNILSINNPTGD